MNKKTLSLTDKQYKELITTIRTGFMSHRPNPRIAEALMLEANLGLRISDIVKLQLSDFVKDGERYRLDITEHKTGKRRTFTVPAVIYNHIKMYVLECGIKPHDKISLSAHERFRSIYGLFVTIWDMAA